MISFDLQIFVNAQRRAESVSKHIGAVINGHRRPPTLDLHRIVVVFTMSQRQATVVDLLSHRRYFAIVTHCCGTSAVGICPTLHAVCRIGPRQFHLAFMRNQMSEFTISA
ncbi:hypothetical protein FHX77_000610 [Bifidobacterium commune]|uniref:Uncharacterized protein n=1 Tax=Bifidobacterium commune TaxID=1505727 RepID=A0A1C4GZY5_9BIFI|nr:hypothetical protein [Bifidobacterium commune]SCC78179.1 hypothetical protein GA0061077_0137 [Bifidobacterium commune]